MHQRHRRLQREEHQQRQRKRKDPPQPCGRQRRAGRERQHEGQQIERQRHHPDQRERAQVGADLGGDAQHQRRGQEGQEGPVADGAPAQRRRIRRPGRRDHRDRTAPVRGEARQQQHRPEQQEADRPADRDVGHAEQRLGRQRKGQQRDQRPQVAGPVEKIGVIRAWPPALPVPGLDQRGIGRQDRKRQADPERVKPQRLQHDRPAGVIGPVPGHRQRQEHQRQQQQGQMHGDLRADRQVPADQMGVEIPPDQHRLEEQHRRRPDRRRAADLRQHQPGVQRLDEEQEQRAGEDRQGEQGHQEAGPAPRDRNFGRQRHLAHSIDARCDTILPKMAKLRSNRAECGKLAGPDQRRRSRRALIGWKATPTWASQ